MLPYILLIFGVLTLNQAGAEDLLSTDILLRLGKHVKAEMVETTLAYNFLRQDMVRSFEEMLGYNDTLQARYVRFKNKIDAYPPALTRLRTRLLPYVMQFSEKTELTTFTAQLGPSETMVQGEPVPFTTVDYNLGSAFNATTKKFVAVSGGPHLFLVKLTSANSNPVSAELVHNDISQGILTTTNEASVTNLWILNVLAGDEIWVRALEDGTPSWGYDSQFMALNL